MWINFSVICKDYDFLQARKDRMYDYGCSRWVTRSHWEIDQDTNEGCVIRLIASNLAHRSRSVNGARIIVTSGFSADNLLKKRRAQMKTQRRIARIDGKNYMSDDKAIRYFNRIELLAARNDRIKQSKRIPIPHWSSGCLGVIIVVGGEDGKKRKANRWRRRCRSVERQWKCPISLQRAAGV